MSSPGSPAVPESANRFFTSSRRGLLIEGSDAVFMRGAQFRTYEARFLAIVDNGFDIPVGRQIISNQAKMKWRGRAVRPSHKGYEAGQRGPPHLWQIR